MQNIEITIGGVNLTFKTVIENDYEQQAPWLESDGHGTVSDWVTRSKKPGEIVLASQGAYYRFYDFQGALKKAKFERWDAYPYNDGSETKTEQALKAVLADVDYLKGWINDEWNYVGVIVTLLDSDGNDTDVSDSMWGVEKHSDESDLIALAKSIADDLAHGLHTQFEVVETQTTTFKRI